MIHYECNKEHNSLELYFDTIPPEKVRKYLRTNGWYWSHTKQCWHTQHSAYTEIIARQICVKFASKNCLKSPSLEDLSFAQNSKKIKRCCYAGTLEKFLETDINAWTHQMVTAFSDVFTLPLEKLQVAVWADCYKVLKEQLPLVYEKHPGFQIIFEYALPYESGRRPDVLLISNEYVLVLEFKKKDNVLQADLDQVSAYCRDLEEYHFESRNKHVIPLLVVTEMRNINQHSDCGVHVCSGNQLAAAILTEITVPITPCDINTWIYSKYEPLPTIIQAARMIMEKEELPHIRRVGSTGIPEAVSALEKVTQYAQERRKHIIVMVTGVPGAGKTFLGLQFVYNVCQSNNSVNSIYLSGNGPLVRVLTDALHSSVFVKDLHKVINEYLHGAAQDFSSNVIVFDEGQRAWDCTQMEKARRGHNNSEPDVMIHLAEDRLQWCVLLVLVGEGQEIYRGENAGLKQWNSALDKAKLPWEIICPDKLASIFQGKRILRAKSRNLLDLTVSLRSHLAGNVSKFVNLLIDGKPKEAEKYVHQIKNEGFSMFVTRDLDSAKSYCQTRYKGQLSKRYGLIASSKEDLFMKRFGVDNSFNATSLRYLDIGAWFNTDSRSGASCCNLEKVVTEFGCQGLELDMPIICWGPDMIWNGTTWNLYRPYESPDSDDNIYRANSYRVLLTRGRDGFIVFVPNDPVLDQTYTLLLDLGIQDLK